VDLAKTKTLPKTSARNCFTGTVAEIKDDATVSEVVVAIDDKTQLCSLMSSQSVREMGLSPGDTVTAYFKALSVVLAVD
jgi:molybdate transport system regulatory protein